MNIFDEELIIVVESPNLGGVYSVNGKAGFVTINKSDVGLSNVENISIIGVSGYLQNQINNISGVGGGSGVTGDYYLNSNPSGFITGVDTSSLYPRSNPSGFIGNYNYKADINYDNQYLRQEGTLNGQELNFPLFGIKNGDIVNLYFSDSNPVDNGVKTTYSKTLKVNPGILVDHNGAPSSRNLIKFDDTTQYSGKAIRKVRYNSTIGNGYERILLSLESSGTSNCPIIRPKTRRLETFYDISVPSGGGGRVFLFKTPTSFPFVQGTCMNLRFSFEADNSPCVISGLVSGTNEHVLTLSGANYGFVQKERVILISKGADGKIAEFKHW